MSASQQTPAASPASHIPSSVPAEERGAHFARTLHEYIQKNQGRYLRSEDAGLFVFLKGQSIPLDGDDIQLSRLLLQACNVTTVTIDARIAVKRLQVTADENARTVSERYFSAVSKSRAQIYIPLNGSELLRISKTSLSKTPNITNEDDLWLRHPEKSSFEFNDGSPQVGLAAFEALLVNTLSCKHDEMRWFLAMHEGLFPLVRDLATHRFLVIHEGPTQQGKTTGAQRFTLLHGLGDVIGDGSVAALANQKDLGLLVLDNKEQKNLNQGFIDFCLFLCTGAQRRRSNKDGSETIVTNKFRPAGVITSIEGVHKAELAARNVVVEFSVKGRLIGRENIEREISDKRHEINSSLVRVLQRFLFIREERRPTPNPFNGNFEAHFAILCDLLRAFADVAEKSQAWAEKLINDWYRIITVGSNEPDDSEYEYHIREILYSADAQDVQRKDGIEVRGRLGTLFVLQCGFLHSELIRKPGLLQSLPRNVRGFSNRLGTENFQGLIFLRGSDAPEYLKRKNKVRYIGFFEPSDEVTVGDTAPDFGVTDLNSTAPIGSELVVTT
jgi:hypothetical protein